jgi:molybdate transport system substrate-binding protein
MKRLVEGHTRAGETIDKLNVMTAYHAALPEFERSTGIAVTTLSGASQGTGFNIKHQHEHGEDVDVVILCKEGPSELVAAVRIVDGSDEELVSVAAGGGRPCSRTDQ